MHSVTNAPGKGRVTVAAISKHGAFARLPVRIYVYVDGICLKRSWGGEIQNVSIFVVIGVSMDGYRTECRGEETAGWHRGNSDLYESSSPIRGHATA